MKEVKTPKKPLAIYYTIVLLLILLLNVVLVPWMNERQIKEVDYGTFMSMTEEKNIGKVDIESNQIIFTDKDNTQVYKTGLMDDSGLTERLYTAGAEFSSEIVEQGSPVLSFLIWFVLPIILFTALGGAAGLALAWAYRRWARRHFERTGQPRSRVLAPLVIVAAGLLAGWAAAGMPREWSVPVPGTFTMDGGASATPEFMALLLGLVLYTSAFISEVVRAGIQSVAHGQIEAASSIGLSKHQAMRLVILPQALRVIIPPMTSQYLNLTKNSSLAVAVGYPDVVSIANTALNQTGRAVECIAIIMLVYLTTSLSTSAFMNWYNARAAIKER